MMSDTYDKQIEALLNEDFARFAALVSADPDRVCSQYHAWGNTGTLHRSLFAYLPGCAVCASQVDDDWYLNAQAPGSVQYYRDLFGADRLMLRIGGLAFLGETWSSAELAEFARRQRLANNRPFRGLARMESLS